MSGLGVDVALLKAFEDELDPRFPERGSIPAKVLGYGEISTVLQIGTGPAAELAYKRMPVFVSEQEADRYGPLYDEYNEILRDLIGIRVPPSARAQLVDKRGRTIFYAIQRKLAPESIGNRAIHYLSPEEVRRLVHAALQELRKVFEFNRGHKDELEIGIDGQISNWAVANFDARDPRLGDEIELAFVDTSTPFIRKKGKEQLDPELFLRSAPSFLVWLIRLLFLKQVMTRYYDFRLVAIDLVANFYKEQRPELVPELVGVVNDFFRQEAGELDLRSIAVADVRSYYREDALIWRTYLSFRKVDRFLHTAMGKRYAYILPESVKR